MILSYRKREDSPQDNENGTFREIKTRSRSPEDTPVRRREKKAKSFGGFWLNLFRSPVGNQSQKRRTSHQIDDIGIHTKTSSPSSSFSSAESVNTIMSTHSFSFVSPRSYVGRKERKRGKRIPMEVNDNNFRSKPQKPCQSKGNNTKIKRGSSAGTLTRIGLKFGLNLKSKYNLQSCESLAVNCSESSTLQRRNIEKIKKNYNNPGPSSDIKNQKFIASSHFESKRHYYSKECKYEVPLETLLIQKNLNSQNEVQNFSITSTQKKRRAPPPPTQISNSTLLIPSNSKENQNLNFGANENKEFRDRHRRCQSETPAGETIRTRLHVNGKRRAPNPPLAIPSHDVVVPEKFEPDRRKKIIELPTVIDIEEKMFTRKHQTEITEHTPNTLFTAPVPISNGQVIEPKFHPRPWYKRNPKKNQEKRQIQNPITNLPNLSNLDREAARIIEENHRRSAEQAYNQTAKDLITMFNQNFTKSEQVEVAQSKVNDPHPLTVEKSSQAQAYVDLNTSKSKLVPSTKNLPYESEEKKKLAIVQPQKFEMSKTAVSSIHLPLQNSQEQRREIEVLPRSTYQKFLYQNNEREWKCPRCTLSNPHWRALCDACYLRKGCPANQKKDVKSQAQDINTPKEEICHQSSKVNGLDEKVNDSCSKLKKTSPSGIKSSINKEIIKENNNFPSCENFLSQVPSKDLSKEKLLGVKLFQPLETDYEELNIEALREARVAFFTKHSSSNGIECKPNNLNYKNYEKEFKESNLPPIASESTDNDELSDDLEVIDLLLKIYQETQLNSNENGRIETLKSKKFKPILATVLESSGSNCQNIDKIYKELRSQNSFKGKRPTNSFMQQNIQKTIQKQLLLYDSVMEETTNKYTQGIEATVEEYRKQGAIPKHLIQGHVQNYQKGQNSTADSNNGSSFIVSSVLRKLDWAISHGDFRQAAKLAFELATHKPDPITVKLEEPITIRVYVEDRLLQQGPFVVTVTDSMTIAMLKTKIESDWGIPANFQKWILGKKMAEGDEDLISNYGLQNDTLSFLYLVTPDFETRETNGIEKAPNDKKTSNLENLDGGGKSDTDTSSSIIDQSDTTKIETTNLQSTIKSSEEEFLLNLKETKILPISEMSSTNLTPNLNCKIENIGIVEKSEENVLHEIDKFTSMIDIPKNVTLNTTKESTPPKIETSSTSAPTVEENVDTQCNVNTINSQNENEITPSQSSTGITTSEIFTFSNETITKKEVVENKCQPLPKTTMDETTHIEPIRNEQTPALVVKPLTYLQRRSSCEDSKSFTSLQNHISLPLGRRFSGTLSKQIEKFEALNNPRKSISETHGNNSSKLEKSEEQILSKTNVEVSNTKNIGTDNEKNALNYMKLLELEKSDLIRTEENIDCPICLTSVAGGIVLRDCLHTFCQECLVGAIQYAEDAQVKCPFRDKNYTCDSIIQEREIKALVSKEIFHRLLAQSVKLAECKMANAFHCKTNDCPGWCVFEDNVNIFRCPVCSKSNCLNCQAIHEGYDCRQYQREFAIAAEADEDAKSSRLMLEKMIERGEALDCPACHVVLLKKWGCDWVRCSYCKTEICWVTKGFRWGPNGKGDISGGCKCGLNGVKCHPKCTYCH